MADKGKFCGGNVVFIAPDDMVAALRKRFLDLEIENDVFGVREAKGLSLMQSPLLAFCPTLSSVAANDSGKMS